MSDAAATTVIRALLRRGETVAVAESLTGGLVGAALTDVPGASGAFRGGIVAYATPLKEALLGVPGPLLGRVGAVDPDVALAMARGVRERLAATYGLATTGVAGPDPQDGKAPGTVCLAACGPAGERSVTLALAGDRAAVRQATVAAALALLAAAMTPSTAT